MDGGNEHFTKCSSKFGETFIEIFHARFLLRYLKYYTKSCRNISAKFLEIFRFLTQNFEPIFLQPCRNISRKITRNAAPRFALALHGRFLKLYRNIWCKLATEETNISRNILASTEQHLLKYFTKASGEDTLKPLTQNLSQTFLQSFAKYSDLGHKLINQYFHKLAEIFPERLEEILRKNSHYHYTEGFWYFSEIFDVRFRQRTRAFHEMFWQVWSNIYWNISRKLLVKIL